MWLTSLPGVRRKNFELFFYTHQLYVVFVVFLALHVGDFVFMMAGAGIFLFMLDRFLRFFQSRKTVDILSATCFPCGTVELVISKPASKNKSLTQLIYSLLHFSVILTLLPSRCRFTLQRSWLDILTNTRVVLAAVAPFQCLF